MGKYRVSRSASIAADPALVHRLVNDLREWPAWSPWEAPDIERTWSGAESGVGAHYSWSGTRRAGRGTTEITASTPERIEVALSLARPYRSTSHTTFDLAASGQGTDVTWSTTGERTGVRGLVGRALLVDRFVARDVERGLARLKAAAEA